MFTQKTAAWYLSNATATCSIPLIPEQFRRKDRALHDFVLFAHVPVRSYKQAGQWKFMDKDVLSAGRTVAELPWDRKDLVSLKAPEQEARRLDGFTHAGWRTEIEGVIHRAGAANGCHCRPPQAADGQHSSHAAGDCLLKHHQRYAIACTLPVRALVWSGTTWMIPRTLAWILDQRDETEYRLHATGQQCGGCGALSSDSLWRTPTANGWKTVCPACAAANLRPYRRELQGVSYARVRQTGPSPADYLCAMCETSRPATDWDHCHGHDLIRGPLCGSCNTLEGQGKEFLARPGSLQYLMQCDGCRARRTLPAHHRLAALRRHLHVAWGIQKCDWPLHMHVIIEGVDGGYDCTIYCTGPIAGPEPRVRAQRDVHLTHEDAERILSLSVEEGLVEFA
ncbi:endonuclease domain-containing protein [Streptomyces diastaticus]|uniref:endonuclease domain-containing protein n=1 Tax=Streptomyces TaxID=1883 RepID=UPI0027856EF7|nr:endonuclease domain-containing protein [Streptomyces sp. DSM 41037]MDQ0297541.1 hypothetical protein [Streptomyces sp. DSM 41037]